MIEHKILEAIPQLQRLDEEKMDLILGAINSCTIVQNLEKLKSPTDYTQRLDSVLGKENTNN